ncbi:hypothetical protein PM082_009702 [Marasmius tenuissimus]|nr:hypothetical protein PM082_009702 [Marasmius tenuissimus]
MDLVQAVQDLARHLKDPTHQTDISPASYLIRIKQGPERERSYVFMTLTLLADAVVAYRGILVWKSKPVVAVIPFLLWLGLLATVIGNVAANVLVFNGTFDELLRIRRWTTSFFVASLITNVISTGLLAFKIWRIDRENSEFRVGAARSTLMAFLRVAIDSGMLYTFSLSLTIFVYVRRPVWQPVVVYSMTSVICISFYMMLIRIAREARRKVITVRSVFNSKDEGLRGFTLQTGSFKITDDHTDGTYKGEIGRREQVAEASC